MGEAIVHLEKRQQTEKRVCVVCKTEKLLTMFSGHVIKHMEYLFVSFRTTCKKCDSQKNVKNVATAKAHDDAYRRACGYWNKVRNKGQKSNLKLSDIRMLLGCPCYYCRSRDSEITLDRKDSSIGYLKSNVVPCCWRCNTLKSDMPWDAWVYLAPAVYHASKLGLFGKWREEIPARARARAKARARATIK